MSTYSQDSNKSNSSKPSINAKSQHSPRDDQQRNDQRNPGTTGAGNAGKSDIKPSQPHQGGKINNPNDKQKGDNRGSTGRNA